MTLLVIIGIVIVLFGLAFFTRRRFGVLGLALAAGTVLAQYATNDLANVLQHYNVSIGGIDHKIIASIFLIVSPALLLLAGGPTYHDKKSAIIGATAFSLLGMFFMLGPLSSILPADNAAMRDVLVMMSNVQNYVIIAALLFALIDTFMIHGSVGRRYHKDKKH